MHCQGTSGVHAGFLLGGWENFLWNGEQIPRGAWEHAPQKIFLEVLRLVLVGQLADYHSTCILHYGQL